MNADTRLEMIEEWVRAYQVRLRAYLYSRTGDRNTTDDLAQDVFLAAVEGIDRFDTSRDPWPWLMSIAHNTLRRHWSLRGGNTASARIEQLVAVEQLRRDEGSAVGGVEDRLEALRTCREKLPARARRWLAMIYDEGRNCVEVAARIGKDPVAVRTAIHRIRERLRLCVESELKRGAP